MQILKKLSLAAAGVSVVALVASTALSGQAGAPAGQGAPAAPAGRGGGPPRLAQGGAGPIKVLLITKGHAFERQAFFELFDSLGDTITWTHIEHPAADVMM